MKREFLDYVDDVIDAMSKAQEFTSGMDFKKFSKDGKTVFAVTRAIEIIGEAVKHVTESYREKHPEIEWKKIAGMRDVLIHEYFQFNLKRVWKTIQEDIPKFKEQVKSLPEMSDI